MPALSPTMTEGTLIQWHVSEGETCCIALKQRASSSVSHILTMATGDEISAGDGLFDIETDKATMLVEATEDGFLAKILIESGTSSVPVGELVALMVEDEGEEPEFTPAPAAPAAPTAPAVPVAPTTFEAPSAPAAPAAPSIDSKGNAAKPLSPAVLALVNRHQLDASAIPATGPKGHILKGDLLAFLEGRPAPAEATHVPEPPAEAKTASIGARPEKRPIPTDIPATSMRKTIAKRLVESKTSIPHAYSSTDVDLTDVRAPVTP